MRSLDDRARLRSWWPVRIAGLLWVAGGLCSLIYFVGPMRSEVLRVSLVRLLFPLTSLLMAVCGFGLLRRSRWSRLPTIIISVALVLVMLDALVMLLFHHDFGGDLYAAGAGVLLGIYTAVVVYSVKHIQ